LSSALIFILHSDRIAFLLPLSPWVASKTSSQGKAIEDSRTALPTAGQSESVSQLRMWTCLIEGQGFFQN
jgi:hypothetical protein